MMHGKGMAKQRQQISYSPLASQIASEIAIYSPSVFNLPVSQALAGPPTRASARFLIRAPNTVVMKTNLGRHMSKEQIKVIDKGVLSISLL